jgi:hypothetical protein
VWQLVLPLKVLLVCTNVLFCELQYELLVAGVVIKFWQLRVSVISVQVFSPLFVHFPRKTAALLRFLFWAVRQLQLRLLFFVLLLLGCLESSI